MPTANLSLTATPTSMTRIGDALSARTQAEMNASLERAGHEPTTNAEAFEDRNGYLPAFLDGWNIGIPQLTGDRKSDMRELRRGGTGIELKYENFSVVMSVRRRLPLITAVNIDGAQTKKEARLTAWSFDGRLNKEDQVGDELYDNNILDRGHMVRREDPVWGARSKKANDDTFHFTNSCPQIAGVNQQIWLGLENYVLLNAKKDDMKVNVYTGPYFDDKKDMEYRGVKIPAAFWKVVAIVTDEGRPSATAYRISQKKELGDLEFVYGKYKTFQISIKSVMKATHLDFSALIPYDGISRHEEGTGEVVERTLNDLSDIMI